MIDRHRQTILGRAACWLTILLLAQGCAIKMGPDLLVTPQPMTDRPPVLRVGEITEAITGTWTQDPGIGTSVLRSHLIDAFKQPAIASRFSPESSNLTMNLDLTTDHESDAPRLGNLGGLSMATLGIIPLNYFSHWDVDCKVTMLAENGTQVATYNFQERGTYSIWAFPLTMFTLAGAGIRGDSDGRTVFDKVADSLAAKIADAIDKDYEKLSAHVKKLQPIAAPSLVESQKPLIV